MPRPVTQPIRAATDWITAISGKLNSMVQASPWPNWAPTWLIVRRSSNQTPSQALQDSDRLQRGHTHRHVPRLPIIAGGLRLNRRLCLREAGQNGHCGNVCDEGAVLEAGT